MSEECRAGCCPHDGDARGPGCPADLPGGPLAERVVHLRGCQLLTVRRIAALTGADRPLITRLLYEAATGEVHRGAVRRMSVRTADDERFDRVLARMAQEDRLGAVPPAPPAGRGPSENELLAALRADPEVRLILGRHGVTALTTAGPPWARFPARQPLTAGLVGDLYEGCGLSLHHIELLTGRPAAAVGARLRASGVKLRPPGVRSPFTDRWRPARD